MGLDDFSSSGTANNVTRSNTTSRTKQQKQEEQDPYKVVHGDKNRKKVFATEEEWNETVEFIEEEMNMSIGEVMDMSADQRHEILHQAILKSEDNEKGGFRPTKTCVVCGKKFIFPKKWNFVLIKNEASCGNHEIGEVVENISGISVGGA